jgi:endonuclease YncB( thermonuclease family)
MVLGMSQLKELLLFLVFSIASGAFAELPRDVAYFSLKRVVDGDTIVTGENTRVRLWGIDAPERDQPHGASATDALAEMLSDQTLYLETKAVDKYGRLVGIIFNADDHEVNLQMVCAGHAWWYERYAKEALDYKQSQQDASNNERGLWVDENPVAPWDWRRR